MIRTAVLLLVLAVPLPGAAGQPAARHPAQAPQQLSIPRVSTPPALEDYLDGTPRADEVAVTQFYQREPGDGVPVSQPTEAYLSYDDQYLYIVFVARDSDPQSIRATLAKREAWGNDDFVGLMLDTFNDKRRSYLFVANPFGIQLDGVSADGEHDDYSFDTVWQSAGRLTDFGYVVRIAIPFKSLRFPNAEEQQWGIALLRGVRRSNETAFWPYITRRIANLGQQMATATGLRDVSPGRNMQFIPYAAFTRARFLDADAPAIVRDTDGRAGIDAKLIIKDAFALDATLNPDFSQVESDEPQVTINQRFEVFFPEKRPFFIENASYFQTPINLFFSRRIADPQAGVRVTGKTGGWAVGGLAIDDRAPGRAVAAGDPAYRDRTGIGVVRLQRDLPRQSTIGVLATTRDFADSESRVLSVDGRYRLSDTWTLTGQAAVSHFQPLAGTSQTGPAMSLELDRSGRSWGAFLRYEDISADFRAPLGFVRRVDMRQLRPFVRYTWFPRRGALVSIRPELSGSVLWDQGGTLQDWEVNTELQLELTGQTSVEANYDETMERFAGIEFRKRGGSFRFDTSSWVKWLEAAIEVERGREINFFPAAGLLPFLASATGAEASITLKPVPPLRIDQTYLFTRLTAQDDILRFRPGAVIVDNHIWRTRASYQFTRALSLRAILDYASVAPETGLIDLERDKDFSADLLVTYQVNPWTALYVGYADAYANREIDPLTRDRIRFTDSVFNSTGRQVFVKMSYLLRF